MESVGEHSTATQTEPSTNAVSTLAKAEKPLTIHGHPALLKWTPPRAHALNASQFAALTAICDAYIPSLPPPENYATMQGVTPEDVAEFFKLKASDEDIIDVVRFHVTANSKISDL